MNSYILDLLYGLILSMCTIAIVIVIFDTDPTHEYRAVCDSGFETEWTAYVHVQDGIVKFEDGDIIKKYKQLPGETCWEEKMLIETD